MAAIPNAQLNSLKLVTAPLSYRKNRQLRTNSYAPGTSTSWMSRNTKSNDRGSKREINSGLEASDSKYIVQYQGWKWKKGLLHGGQ